MKKIEDKWKNYAAKLALMGFTSEALIVSRKMFYSGVISLMNLLTEGEPQTDDNPETEYPELHDISGLIVELKEELNDYSIEDQKIRLYSPKTTRYKM